MNFIVIAGFGGFGVGLWPNTFCFWLTAKNVHRNRGGGICNTILQYTKADERYTKDYDKNEK